MTSLLSPEEDHRGLRPPAGEAHDSSMRFRALPVGERVTLAVLLAVFVMAVLYVVAAIM